LKAIGQKKINSLAKAEEKCIIRGFVFVNTSTDTQYILLEAVDVRLMVRFLQSWAAKAVVSAALEDKAGTRENKIGSLQKIS
jgi:hypothetical protein